MDYEDLDAGFYTRGSFDVGPAATAVSGDSADRLFKYYTQLDPTVFDNINSTIQDPFQKAAQTTLIGDNRQGYDDLSAEALLQIKHLYKPEELNSIINSYVTQTGDNATGELLQNLFGSDTTLADTAIAEAGKIPLGAGDITAAGYTTEQLNKIGSDAASGNKGILSKLGDAFKNLTGISGGDALKYATMMAMAKLAYDDAKQAREEAKGAKLDIAGVRAVRGADGGVSFRSAAQGGLMSMVDDVDPIATAQRVMTDPEHQRKFEGYLMEYLGQEQGYAEGGVARYFAGGTDGMADEIPANIENQRPAALSDGEFVIPADVVSHLGNGNSNAGAKRLYEMMDRIRDARTGTTKQGIEIDPNKFMLG